MITVYFDDQCGLCSKEIAVYKRADKSNSFEWLGLSDQTLDLKSEGLELVAALERLHVKDNTGRVYVGVDAFITIWQHLPRWRLLAQIASVPPIHWLLTVGYAWFAKRRFKQLTHCQLALKQRSRAQQ